MLQHIVLYTGIVHTSVFRLSVSGSLLHIAHPICRKPPFVAMATSLCTSGPPSRSVQPVLHRWPQSVPIPYNGTPLPLIIAYFHGESGPHLTHGSDCQRESSTQTAFRSVQLFLEPKLKCIMSLFNHTVSVTTNVLFMSWCVLYLMFVY